MATQILHVTQQFSAGGAGRALLALLHQAAIDGIGQHEVLSLKSADARMAGRAREAGASVIVSSDSAIIAEQIARADAVVVHFWNSPEIYGFLANPWPPMRGLIWSHVSGEFAPHIFNEALLGWPDRFAISCSRSASLPGVADAVVTVPAGADLHRLGEEPPEPHPGFRVGYLGTVDFVKMHPDFVRLHSCDLPGLEVVIAGEGGALPKLKQQVDASGCSERYRFLGYQDDVGAFLRSIDVLGYPLAVDTSATGEFVLQEAMWVGVPPIVLDHGSPAAMVTHRETGWVATSESDYQEGLRWLCQAKEERIRLGVNARRHARSHFGLQRVRPMWAVLESMLSSPKRTHPSWLDLAGLAATSSGAERMAASYDTYGASFTESLRSESEEALLAAEEIISRSSPGMCNAGGGGLLHHRHHWPADPYLHLWSGLVLAHQGRPALAIREFQQAIQLGLRHWRVSWYLARAAAAARAHALALTSLDEVGRSAPDFAPGLELRQQLLRQIELTEVSDETTREDEG